MLKLLAAALAVLTLAASPSALAAKNSKGPDLAAREAAFEQRLAKIAQRDGPNSDAVVHALSGFGVELFSEDDPRANTASLVYLRRAVDIALLAYGEKHPEYAVELHSYAMAVRGLGAAAAYPDAVAAIRKAHAIRVEALGEADAGTANALGTLASMLSAPAYLAQSPGACAEAVPLADALMDLTARHKTAYGAEVLFMYGYAAETYGHCREVAKAFAAADAVNADAALEPNLARMSYTRAADALDAAGLADQAKALRKLYPGLEAYAGS